jgi:hypothetical protein
LKINLWTECIVATQLGNFWQEGDAWHRRYEFARAASRKISDYHVGGAMPCIAR